MNTRIKEIRSRENLSMKAFGERIGISPSGVAALESGRNKPSEQTMRSLCQEFNISRSWLETGEGDMYNAQPLVPELVRVLRKSPALFGALTRLAAVMDDRDWEILNEVVQKAIQKENSPEP